MLAVLLAVVAVELAVLAVDTAFVAFVEAEFAVDTALSAFVSAKINQSLLRISTFDRATDSLLGVLTVPVILALPP